MKEFLKNSDLFFGFINGMLLEDDRVAVLNKLVEEIREYIMAERCTLFIYDKKINELVSKVAQGADEIRIPSDKSCISGYVYQTGETVYVNDAYSQKQLANVNADIQISSRWDEKHSFKTKNALATPIMARGKRIGVFLAMNKPGGFIDSSADGVREFATLLGLGIEIVLLNECVFEGKSKDDLPF
jgi:GAF domain-containing protein